MSEHAYRDAGVDIDLEAAAVKALIGQLSYRRQGSYPMLGKVGHFAGLRQLELNAAIARRDELAVFHIRIDAANRGLCGFHR